MRDADPIRRGDPSLIRRLFTTAVFVLFAMELAIIGVTLASSNGMWQIASFHSGRSGVMLGACRVAVFQDGKTVRTVALGTVAEYLGLVAFPLFAMEFVGIRLRRRREKSGRCGQCGYDLRASTERCPECGTPIASNAGVPA